MTPEATAAAPASTVDHDPSLVFYRPCLRRGQRRPAVVPNTGADEGPAFTANHVAELGIRPVLQALENPQVRLANVPAHMSRVLRITGLSHVVDDRTRFDVAVATAADFDVACAERIASVFARANDEGCSYDLAWLPFDPTTPVPYVDHRRFHCLVVPSLHRWLGLSDETNLARWIQQLAMRSDRVVGVGTGLAVLAAGGLLDGRRIAAQNCEPGFAALAPPIDVVRPGCDSGRTPGHRPRC